MLACKHCSTPNSLDSTFCKKCGTAVPADGKREALVQLDRLVEEGLSALAAGRTSEALAIADAAIVTDPTHLGALQLKAAVHERRGEIAEALESAERIVELNPDSELDRIKRNGLRTSLLDVAAPVQTDRRIAFAAAAAATVLVVCAGVLLARRPAAPTVVATGLPTGPIVESPVVAPNQRAEEAPVAPQTSPQTAPIGTSAAILPGASERTAPVSLPRNPGFTRLPNPTGPDAFGGPIDPSLGALPVRDAAPATKPTVTPPPARRGGDPDPGAVRDTAKPDEDPGQIDISVTRSGPRRSGGSVLMPAETRTNGADAYARVGTEKFELGDYAGAATNLEKAISGGGDAVNLNRRLAQAYGRLGRNSDAAAAYERSRAAAVAALASGKGDKERLQSARDAAEAGLKTVKGG